MTGFLSERIQCVQMIGASEGPCTLFFPWENLIFNKLIKFMILSCSTVNIENFLKKIIKCFSSNLIF